MSTAGASSSSSSSNGNTSAAFPEVPPPDLTTAGALVDPVFPHLAVGHSRRILKTLPWVVTAIRFPGEDPAPMSRFLDSLTGRGVQASPRPIPANARIRTKTYYLVASETKHLSVQVTGYKIVTAHMLALLLRERELHAWTYERLGQTIPAWPTPLAQDVRGADFEGMDPLYRALTGLYDRITSTWDLPRVDLIGLPMPSLSGQLPNSSSPSQSTSVSTSVVGPDPNNTSSSSLDLASLASVSRVGQTTEAEMHHLVGVLRMLAIAPAPEAPWPTQQSFEWPYRGEIPISGQQNSTAEQWVASLNDVSQLVEQAGFYLAEGYWPECALRSGCGDCICDDGCAEQEWGFF